MHIKKVILTAALAGLFVSWPGAYPVVAQDETTATEAAGEGEAPAPAEGEKTGAEEAVPPTPEIPEHDYPNPHYAPGYCSECHVGVPVRGAVQNFRTDNMNELCNRCHEDISVHAYIHAVGMRPSEGKLGRMPPSFKEALYRGSEQGKLTCIVCHDVPIQCLKERYSERDTNPMFFRGGPYRERADLCYNCHETQRYRRFNPHDQINDEGDLVQDTCTFCHDVVPNRRRARSIRDVTFRIDEDLKRLCTGCHPVSKHPEWTAFKNRKSEVTQHLVEPPENILRRIRDTQDIYPIVLPLDPTTGKIFCCTCHNPHERGVQRNINADKGADWAQRLRSVDKPICIMCHNF